MKRKDVFRMVRYLCVAGIAIFGLVAIVGTGSDDVKDATCVDGTVSGTYTYTDATKTITVKVTDASLLPDEIDLSDLGFILNQEYSYTLEDDFDPATAMNWLEGGVVGDWKWERKGTPTADFTGTWIIEDKGGSGIDYELTIDPAPDNTFTLKATKCLLD